MLERELLLGYERWRGRILNATSLLHPDAFILPALSSQCESRVTQLCIHPQNTMPQCMEWLRTESRAGSTRIFPLIESTAFRHPHSISADRIYRVSCRGFDRHSDVFHLPQSNFLFTRTTVDPPSMILSGTKLGRPCAHMNGNLVSPNCCTSLVH